MPAGAEAGAVSTRYTKLATDGSTSEGLRTIRANSILALLNSFASRLRRHNSGCHQFFSGFLWVSPSCLEAAQRIEIKEPERRKSWRRESVADARSPTPSRAFARNSSKQTKPLEFSCFPKFQAISQVDSSSEAIHSFRGSGPHPIVQLAAPRCDSRFHHEVRGSYGWANRSLDDTCERRGHSSFRIAASTGPGRCAKSLFSSGSRSPVAESFEFSDPTPFLWWYGSRSARSLAFLRFPLVLV